MAVIGQLAAASPETLSVTWDAAPSCPQAQDVRARLVQLSGRDAHELPVELVGHVRQSGEDSRWQLDLEVRTVTGVYVRHFEAADCAALAESAALIAVVFTDPSDGMPQRDVTERAGVEPHPPAASSVTSDAAMEHRRARLGEERTPTAGESRDAKAAPAVRPKAVRPKAASRSNRSETSAHLEAQSRFGVWTRLRGGGEYGAVPRGTGGFELAIAFGGRKLRGEITGSYWLPRIATAEPEALRVQLGTVGTRLCGTVPVAVVDVVACGGAEFGFLRGDFTTIAGPAENLPWLAFLGELGVRWSATDRVSLYASALPVVPVFYPKFELYEAGEPSDNVTIHQVEPAGIRALFGVEVRLSPARLGSGRGRVSR